MERVDVSENDFLFDTTLHRGLPEGGDIAFVVKDKATESGKPCVMITWTVQLPNGKKATAQAVTTTRLLVQAGMAVAGIHERLTGEKLI